MRRERLTVQALDSSRLASDRGERERERVIFSALTNRKSAHTHTQHDRRVKTNQLIILTANDFWIERDHVAANLRQRCLGLAHCYLSLPLHFTKPTQ